MEEWKVVDESDIAERSLERSCQAMKVLDK